MSIRRSQRKSSRRTSPIFLGATKNFTVLFRSASLAERTLSPNVRNARSHSDTKASHCVGGAGSFGGNSRFPAAPLAPAVPSKTKVQARSLAERDLPWGLSSPFAGG